MFEQRRRSPHAKIMTGKSQTGQILLRYMGEKSVSAFVVEPELEKDSAIALDEAAHGGIGLGSCWFALSEELRWSL